GYLRKERVVDVAEFIEGVRRVADGGLGVDTEGVSELLTRARGAQQPERVVDVAEFSEGGRRGADGGLGVDTEVVSELLTRARGEQPRERVTARERDVLALIAEGKTNQAIAEQFLVAEKAVDSHIRNIFLQARAPLHQPRPPP